MKTKKVLKIYFTAERAERAIDRLILYRAAGVEFLRTAEYCAERVTELIEKKRKFCLLYDYLDGIMQSFSEDERQTLKEYALSAKGQDGREAHRLAVKFTRRAQAGISRFRGGLEIAGEYIM